MDAERFLIVNADDFGQSHGINRGILEAHTRGVVTQVSLMVRWPAAAEAAGIAQAHPELGVGLHVDLGEWRYDEGEWSPLYEVVPPADADAVRAEVTQQLAAFRRLIGREPDHLDSHQHVHQREPARSILSNLGRDLGIPVRHVTPHIRYCGAFYGQKDEGTPMHGALAPDSLIAVLQGLSPGVTELVCHPGYADELASMYVAEREVEIRTLCDPAVCAAIRETGVRLCRARDIVGAQLERS